MSHKSKRLAKPLEIGPLARNRAVTAAQFIAQRKRQEEASLAEDMRRVLELFHDAPGGMIVTVGPTHVIQLINKAYANWIDHRDVVGKTIAEAFPNLARAGVPALLDEVFRTGEARVIRGARDLVKGGDGSQRDVYVDFVLQPLRDADGSVCGIFSQGNEVTNEKLAADRLRESRSQLKAALEESQAIIDNSHDLICTFNATGEFIQINRHAVTLLGYEPSEMIGQNYTQFVHPDDLIMTADKADRIAAGETTNAFINRYVHRDGTAVPIMWSSVWSDSRRVLYCIGRDMREHVAAEEKLRQAQKMEAIGRLTGGVAHDFNNLLTAVIGSAEALTEGLSGQPELREMARVALDAAGRGAELVRQLLALSRNQPLDPAPIACISYLKELRPILQRTLGQGVTVEIEEGPELCCLADRSQLTAAVLNLCINARDAMPEGGQIHLRARQVTGEAGTQALISVADTGEGMTEAVRARALEPFFTTKPLGQGSGLGLSMVYGFVTQSGGRLEIRSEEGAGAEVSLYLPLSDRPEACEPGCSGEAAILANPRVLLVDDDDLVRGEVERQLAALGCQVTAFADPHDVLDALAGEVEADLLMTDISMPGGMNGRQLADHARLLRPAMPILFTSGHTEDRIIRGAGQRAVGAFLPKPYRRADLARKLAEVLQAQ